MAELEEVRLGLDELEAVRMADLEGLYQEEAAERMGVSRQTFGNIVESGRKKIADALVNAKAIILEGGRVTVVERGFCCLECSHAWTEPYGTGRPKTCPHCGSADFQRADRHVDEHGKSESRGCGCNQRRHGK